MQQKLVVFRFENRMADQSSSINSSPNQIFECGICGYTGTLMQLIVHVNESHNFEGSCVPIFPHRENSESEDQPDNNTATNIIKVRFHYLFNLFKCYITIMNIHIISINITSRDLQTCKSNQSTIT